VILFYKFLEILILFFFIPTIVIISLFKPIKIGYIKSRHLGTYATPLEILKCEKKISPTFNTMVIFSTTDFSNHGHPDPLNCPTNMSRKSIALYYFSSGRPKEEVLETHIKNRTYFKSRHGIKNDAYVKKEYVKNFIRKFRFYQFLKNFEKKYIRKKNKISKDK